MIHLLLRMGALALACISAPLAAQTFPLSASPLGWAQPTSPCVAQSDSKSCVVGAPMPADTVVRSAAVSRSGLFGTTASAFMPANPARRGFSVQNQSASSTCYINGQTTATADFNSLKLDPGFYYETPTTHVGTGAISIICTAAATPIYAREW